MENILNLQVFHLANRNLTRKCVTGFPNGKQEVSQIGNTKQILVFSSPYSRGRDLYHLKSAGMAYFENQLHTFWSSSCLPNGKLAHLECYPLGKKSFYCSPNGNRVLYTRRPMVKTFQGVLPLVDKYKNDKKCICPPLVEHVYSCNHFIFSR